MTCLRRGATDQTRRVKCFADYARAGRHTGGRPNGHWKASAVRRIRGHCQHHCERRRDEPISTCANEKLTVPSACQWESSGSKYHELANKGLGVFMGLRGFFKHWASEWKVSGTSMRCEVQTTGPVHSCWYEKAEWSTVDNVLDGETKTRCAANFSTFRQHDSSFKISR